MVRAKAVFISILWAVFTTVSYNLVAQNLSPAVQLDNVDITEARLSQFAVGARTTVPDSATLALSSTSSLADLLNNHTTSHIKAYGNGMLASISFRGTGPEHTAVLWHGVNIAYPMLGQSDFSIIPLALNDEIMVQHGTGSSLYGSGALGGTIALSSVRPLKGTSASMAQWFGSFGTVNNNASLSFASTRYFVKIMTSWNRSFNDFSFRNTTKLGAPAEIQKNAAFEQIGLNLETGLRLGIYGDVVISAQYVDMDRQLQPSMNNSGSNDFQDDNNLRFRTRYSFNGQRLNWYLQYAYLADQINYNGGITTSIQHVMKVNFEKQLSDVFKISLAADHSLVNVQAKFYTGENVAENRTNIWSSLLAIPTSWLTISANLRQGFHPIYEVPLAPSLGAEISLKETSFVRHRISVLAARGFRIPTLNELYWNPGGNLELVPEDSYSAEIGFSGELEKKNRLTYEITGYRMWVSNWILWQPKGSFWSPENIKEVDVYGFEVSGSLDHKLGQARLSWRTNYGYTRSINQTGFDQFDRSVGKQLSYTPIHKGGLTSNLQYHSWQLMANGVAIGQRFTTADNENYLPAYFLLNLGASKIIDLGVYRLDLSATLNNLLNVSYQSVENRAMPGINYLIGVKLSYNKPYNEEINK